MKAFLKTSILRMLWSGALRKVARDNPYVIAITGSVGKTSTKEAIASVLERTGRPVVKSAGNLSTDFGIPLSLFGFTEQPDGYIEWLSALVLALFPPRLTGKGRPYYILEYSAEKPGDIGFLASKIPIDVAVLTLISPVHMYSYDTFQELVKEKTSLFTGLRPEGYAVLNAEDSEQVIASGSLPQVTWYGKHLSAKKKGVTLKEIISNDGGLECSLKYTSSDLEDVLVEAHTHVTGIHQLYPLLAAAAIGFKEGMQSADIISGLESYQLPNGRGRIIQGTKEISIIDDSYNSSPESVKAGLAMLRTYAGDRRTVAVLGAMNELGEMSESAHVDIAQSAASRADYLIFVGKYSSLMVDAAIKSGKESVKVIGFSTTAQLVDKAEHLLQSKDVVYVKGSQNGVRLERFVKRIMAHPDQAVNLLVRQSHFWQKRV